MTGKKPRLLVFGAGIIGSLYALRFMQSGLDVTILARGERLTELQQNGLRYNDKGTIKSVPAKVIETLADDDIYDFIFVPVRYDQAKEALTALKNNKSGNIVTLTNTVGYDDWVAIVGNRLIPGFPGAGGDIKNGVLHAQFGSKRTQGTVFGEIDGKKTQRIKQLAGIFVQAGLPFTIPENIRAFHISHAAIISANQYFYTANGMVDVKTAKSSQVLNKMAAQIKKNIHKMQEQGIPLQDSQTKMVSKMPKWAIVFAFRTMLSLRFTRDVLLGNHAHSAKNEVLQMAADFARLAKEPQV